jgi:hypothetical protein
MIVGIIILNKFAILFGEGTKGTTFVAKIRYFIFYVLNPLLFYGSNGANRCTQRR